MARYQDLNLLHALRHEQAIDGCLARFTSNEAVRSALRLETYAQILASGASIVWQETEVAQNAVQIAHATARSWQLAPANDDPIATQTTSPNIGSAGEVATAERLAARVALLPQPLQDLTILLRQNGMDIKGAAKRLRLTLPQALATLDQAVLTYAEVLHSNPHSAQSNSRAPLGTQRHALLDHSFLLGARTRRAQWIAKRSARWISATQMQLTPAHNHALAAWLSADLRHRAAYLRLSNAWQTTRQLTRSCIPAAFQPSERSRARPMATLAVVLLALFGSQARAESPSGVASPVTAPNTVNVRERPLPARSETTVAQPTRFRNRTVGQVIAIMNQHSDTRIEITDSRILSARVGGALHDESPLRFVAAMQFLFDVDIVSDGNVLRIISPSDHTVPLRTQSH